MNDHPTNTQSTTIHRYVPICIRTRLGYYAGPIGYVESDTCPAPVVLDVRRREKETEEPEET